MMNSIFAKAYEIISSLVKIRGCNGPRKAATLWRGSILPGTMQWTRCTLLAIAGERNLTVLTYFTGFRRRASNKESCGLELEPKATASIFNLSITA
jgi:hypothetical protein